MTKSIKKVTISYEEAIETLENIILTLEKGETTLEESMKLFADGIELSKICSEKIDSIEHRITQLVKDAQCQTHEVEFED